MSAVTVLKTKTVDSKAPDRKFHARGDIDTGCQTIDLVSFLKAENIRLRQAVLLLSLQTRALRDAVRRKKASS